MPDPNGKQSPNKPGDNFSMESRLLLAFALMGVVLLLSQYLFKPAVPNNPKPVKQVQPVKPQEQAKPATPADNTAKNTPAPETSAAPAAAAKEDLFTVDTNLYHIVFSNRGAVVRSWQLKNYKDEKGKPVDLVNQAAAEKVNFPFAIVPKGNITTDVNHALWVAKPADDGLGIDYTFSDGKTSAHKAFRFQQNSYLSNVTSDLAVNGGGVSHMLAWRGGFGDATVANAPKYQHAIYYDETDGKLVVKSVSDAKNGPVSSTGNYSFAGVEDTYFAAVVLPKGANSTEIQVISTDLPTQADPNKTEQRIGAEVGGQPLNQFPLFVGPKDTDLLAKVDPHLTKIIDYGWFTIIARPLFWCLNWVNDHWTRNYGWAIVIVTTLINVLLLPLRFSSVKQMKQMQVLQPQIQAINKKYEGISVRDPKKQDQNQEIMALYQKHGVNPMGGCLPILPQFIILIAYYRVLSAAIEMRGASWLWISDLSQPEKLAIHILPVLMLITQVWLQKMTPNATTDPTQAKMMLLMPVVMVFFFYSAQSGLVLYWLTGNIVGVIQQYFFNKAFHVGGSTAATAVIDATPKKARRK